MPSAAQNNLATDATRGQAGDGTTGGVTTLTAVTGTVGDGTGMASGMVVVVTGGGCEGT